MPAAPVSTPFTHYTKLVTTRLRSRVHGQAFSSAFAALEREKNVSPATKAALARVKELAALQDEHRRGFDPKLKAKAVQQLQSLPLLSAEDDPHFSATLKALRVAAYFAAVDTPVTYALLNHLTKHSYLLDGFNMQQIARVLLELQHPKTAEVLSILLPRLREVSASDVTATEACLLLEVLSVYKVGQEDTVLMDHLTAVMRRTIKDLSLHDIMQCIAALRYVPSSYCELLVRPVLQAADGRLCELLEEAVMSLRAYVEDGFAAKPSLCSVAVEADVGRMTAAPDAAAELAEEAAGEDIAEAERRRIGEKETRQLLLINLRESRALIWELTRTCTWLRWAPRRVLNELARTVMAFSNPHLCRTTADERERERLWNDVPLLSPKDLAFFLRLLSAVNYRHERALLLLSSRIAATAATSSSSAVAAADGSGGAPQVTGVQRPLEEMTALSALTTAVESLALFYMTEATATVTALVKEIAALREHRAAFAAPQQLLVVVDSLSRLFLSLVRLRYSPLPSSQGGAEGEASAIRKCLASLLADDALQWFASGPACVRHPLLTAQLISGVAGVWASASTAESLGVDSVPRLLTQLLVGLRRSELSRKTAAAAQDGHSSEGGSRGEMQRSVADAVATVRSLNVADPQLCEALQDAEAVSVRLL